MWECQHVANHSTLQHLPGLLVHGLLYCLIESWLFLIGYWLWRVPLRRKPLRPKSHTSHPWCEWNLEEQEREKSALRLHSCPFFVSQADVCHGSWRQRSKIESLWISTQYSSRSLYSYNVITLLCQSCALYWKTATEGNLFKDGCISYMLMEYLSQIKEVQWGP